MAPAARAWIETTRSAHVLNVFDRACNLVNPAGEIVTLLAAGKGLNPFGVSLEDAGPAPFRGIRAGSPVRVRPDTLALDGLQVQVRATALWNPRPDWPAVRQAFGAEATWLNRLGEAAAEVAPQGSLLDLWSEGLARERQETPGKAGLLDRARHCGAELIRGLAAASPEVAKNGARGLAGLGGGLTPAGDDFIVGALLAAWAGLNGQGAEEMCPAIAEAATPRTTSLSAAYLRAAARGECMKRWHGLFAAICGREEGQVRSAVRGLLAVGHTSGADSLAGFLAAQSAFIYGEPQALP